MKVISLCDGLCKLIVIAWLLVLVDCQLPIPIQLTTVKDFVLFGKDDDDNFFLKILKNGVSKKNYKFLEDDDAFEEWIEKEKNYCFQGILNNIGGMGKFNASNGVLEGVVIASPSRSDPDYFYQWVRDAALAVNSLVEYLDDNGIDNDDYKLSSIIESYVENSYNLQRITNPSGGFEDLSGLGEPKFLTNNTPFSENWGRPQNDGPALRILTISNFLKILNKYNSKLTRFPNEKYIYENILKNDLKFILLNWNEDSFDLWEEIYSKHLFTSLTQLKALQIGLKLANFFNDQDFYNELSIGFTQLKAFLQAGGFESSAAPYLIETPSLFFKNARKGLDIATILASLRSHDITSIEDVSDIPYDISDPYLLNTFTALVNDMKYRYPINHQRIKFGTIGFGLGRYPEDVYNGVGYGEGNPWFLATATAAEFLYKLIFQLHYEKKNLIISNNNFIIPFNSPQFRDFSSSVVKYADSFLDVVREHVDGQGSMSEQFNKYTGYMEGADDLTWSYGATWGSIRWRNKVLDIMNTTGAMAT